MFNFFQGKSKIPDFEWEKTKILTTQYDLSLKPGLGKRERFSKASQWTSIST